MSNRRLDLELINVIRRDKSDEEVKIKKLKYLLYLGADIDVVDEEGNTPLLVAVEQDEDKIVSFLREQGANENVENWEKCNALMVACLYGSCKCAKIFGDKKEWFECEDCEGRTAIEIASSCGCLEIVEGLYEKGAKYRQKNDTCLMEAAGYGHKDVVKFWLDKGKDVNFRNKQGWNALMRAAKVGSDDVVSLLIERGANLEDKSKEGKSALLYAVISDKTEVVRLLIDKGAKFDVEDKKCMEALTMAVFWDNKEVLKILKKKIDENKALDANMGKVGQGMGR